VPGKRLLETTPDRLPAGLADTVRAFCEPLDLISGAYVGVVQITDGSGGAPREHLAVGLELARAPEQTDEGERELQEIVDRFYSEMPDEVLEGGCNFLLPAAMDAWGEKAQRVFAR
jgi:hypothetical protein